MGCCQSTARDEDHVPPPSEIRASAHSDAVLGASQPPSNAESDPSTPSNGLANPSVPPRSTKRPNKPIRAPSPLRTSPANVSHLPPPWTSTQLANERTAFFDTRVTGRPEVWTALKLVCELLRQDNVIDAQAILDAMNITCPSGRVAIGRGHDRVKGGVYDERGELYELPAWVVVDPDDILGQQDEEDDGDDHNSEKHDDDHDDDAESSNEQAERMRKREQKGKGRAADVGEQISIRLRLSDRGTDVVVSVGTKEPVLAIVKKVREQIGPRRVRLMCLGHVLQENRSLVAQGYTIGNVINAYVFDASEDMLRKSSTG